MLAAAVVLLLLLLAVNVIGARVAEQVVATRLQQTAGLDERPSVSIQGAPFLVQALRGRYDEVAVTARDVPAGSSRFAELTATLRGVRVPLGSVLARDVREVPVQSIEGRVLLSYAELSRRSGDRALTVSAAGDRVRVQGSVRVLGSTLSASAISSVSVEGDEIVVTGERYEVGNALADAVVTRALRDRLDLRLAVRDLPYGLAVRSAEVGPAGVSVLASAPATILSAP